MAGQNSCRTAPVRGSWCALGHAPCQGAADTHPGPVLGALDAVMLLADTLDDGMLVVTLGLPETCMACMPQESDRHAVGEAMPVLEEAM